MTHWFYFISEWVVWKWNTWSTAFWQIYKNHLFLLFLHLEIEKYFLDQV